MNAKYRIDVYESERGWGRSHLGTEEYDTFELAKDAAHEINKKNNLSYVPDYYIFATEPYLVDLDREKN